MHPKLYKGPPTLNPAKLEDCAIFPVADRRRVTLFKNIHAVVLRGSKIVTDCWRGYIGLGKDGYLHETVNHSQTFKDPAPLFPPTITNQATKTFRSQQAKLTRCGRLWGTEKEELKLVVARAIRDAIEGTMGHSQPYDVGPLRVLLLPFAVSTAAVAARAEDFWAL